MSQIRVMPFLQRKGNRVGKAAILFGPEDGVLAGFQMVGFTICDDKEKGLFILFPSSIVKRGEDTKPYFFLRPSEPELLDKLQDSILDIYESMIGFNNKHEIKRYKAPMTQDEVAATKTE